MKPQLDVYEFKPTHLCNAVVRLEPSTSRTANERPNHSPTEHPLIALNVKENNTYLFTIGFAPTSDTHLFLKDQLLKLLNKKNFAHFLVNVQERLNRVRAPQRIKKRQQTYLISIILYRFSILPESPPDPKKYNSLLCT